MTMRFKKVMALLLSLCMMAGLLAGCGGDAGSKDTGNPDSANTQSGGGSSSGSGDSSLSGKRVRVVIGSTSTGGDSYMMADIVTRYLGAEMGFNGKVDPVGNAAALDAITSAKGDGTTIMMFHDMTFLSVLFGAVGEEYSLENLTVGPRFGQNPGACFAANASAPYSNLKEIAEYLKDNPSEVVRVNIEAGASSHLAFAAFWLWVDEAYGSDVSGRIKAIVGGTTDEKKQRLWDGNADVIYGDYSSFVEFTKEGVESQLAMKMFGACGKIEGVTSMADEGVTFQGEPYEFSKDFAMYFPKDMDEGILKEISDAMVKVCQNPEFQAEMTALQYIALTPEETELSASQQFIMDKRELSKALVGAAPSLDSLT